MLNKYSTFLCRLRIRAQTKKLVYLAARDADICAPALSSFLRVQLIELPHARYKGFVLTIRGVLPSAQPASCRKEVPFPELPFATRPPINGVFRLEKDAYPVTRVFVRAEFAEQDLKRVIAQACR